jgi:hypothetical protein
LEQQTDLGNQGGYFPDVQETQFDKLVMIDLQQQEVLDRAIVLPLSVTTVTSTQLPAPVADAVPAIWNSTATALVAGPTAASINSAEANAATATAAAAAAEGAAASVGSITVDNFTGATITDSTHITLSVTPTAASQVLVFVNGTVQHHTTYTLATNILTFSAALPTGATDLYEVIIGAVGVLGATGATGATGTSGSAAPVLMTFDDTDEVDEDKGAGLVWLNNNTHSSATVVYVDDFDAGGADISSWVASWDDVATSSIRGTLIISQNAAPGSNYLMFNITGASTDATAYHKLAVTYVTGVGTLANTDAVTMSFSRTGDAGSGLADVVDDTTPQLGGNLDLNGNTITGMVIGTDVQAEDAVLTDLSALSAVADNEVIVGTGAGTYAHESGATLLSSIGALASGDTSIGKHSIWVPATAMTPTTTNGATAAATNETTATRPDVVGAAFSGSTSQFMQFLVAMPESWAEGTMTFKAVYAGLDAAATYATDTVKWTLQLISFVDDESADTAFTTAVTTITDTTPSAVEDIAVTAVSGAVTVDGTKTAGSNILIGRVGRDIADTMAEDATLIGYLLTYTTDGGVDA